MEKAVFYVLCLVYNDDEILVQDRVKNDEWKGIVLPGGHVEKNESFYEAVIREIKEETNLDIIKPKLCGIKQFYKEDEIRNVVMLYKTNEYSGELKSSIEGEVFFVKRDELKNLTLGLDFMKLLKVFEDEGLSEFMYKKNELDYNIEIF